MGTRGYQCSMFPGNRISRFIRILPALRHGRGKNYNLLIFKPRALNSTECSQDYLAGIILELIDPPSPSVFCLIDLILQIR